MKAFDSFRAAARSGYRDDLDEDARESASLPAFSSGPHLDGPRLRIVLPDLRLRRATGCGAVALVVAIAAALGGCGSTQAGDYGGHHPNYAKALAGSPPPLAGLHLQANELIGGGIDAYRRRIDALAGYPVVVNVWASWCGPCRFEFPLFQHAAASFGRRVAFLGVDSQDSDDAAETFLEEDPVPYPSYTDPGKEIAQSLGANVGLPDTAFYGRDGKLVHLKQGPYENRGELPADIRRYALEGG
jgi:cytochrome c biogenesis protein CcmG/thiol:disulfide interchange protein DsbE